MQKQFTVYVANSNNTKTPHHVLCFNNYCAIFALQDSSNDFANAKSIMKEFNAPINMIIRKINYYRQGELDKLS